MKNYSIVLVFFTLFIVSACNPANKKSDSAPTQEDVVVSESSQLESTEAELSQAYPEDNDCTLNVGFDVWEPYQYVNVNGEVQGLDVELIGYVVSQMGCTLTFTQGIWVDLLEDLKQGRIDVLLGASKTEAREEYAHFSDSYRMEEFSLYIRKDDTTRLNYNDIDEFIANGSHIGIVGDYYYGPSISLMLDGTMTSKYFKPAMMGEMNVGRLLDHDIDAFLEDSFVGASMLRRKGLNNYIEPHGFTVVTGDIFVMFSKQTVEPEQVATFNAKLAEHKYSDDYQLIMEKYSR